ncbi:probable transposon TX1 uncharacterized 149 kDa protein [Coccomyxa sp. Obi]|nr:probable transposon TX1 uncharacterized 149 kDa protein [Coccomyxa sp. Obi]
MAFGTRTRGAASSTSYTAIGGTSSSSRRPTTAPSKKERHGRKKGLTDSAPTGTDPHSGAITPPSLVAILFRHTADTSAVTVRHSSATGRTLLVDFTFGGHSYTVASVYAPAVAAERPAYFMQELLPSLPADRSLLVGGDFNCIAGQQDMLDAAGRPGQRTQGYWTGLRHVETDYQLYDVWRDLNADGRAFTHIATSGQSAARLDRWLIFEHLRARVSAESQATGQVNGYPGDHLGVSLCLTAPRSTCYGAAAWRMPLHLHDDQPFWDRLTVRSGRGAGCAASYPLERATPGAAACLTLAT